VNKTLNEQHKGDGMRKLIIAVALSLASATAFAQNGGAAVGGGAAGGAATSGAVSIIAITAGVVLAGGVISVANDSNSTVTHN
jgi:hypothetical protein